VNTPPPDSPSGLSVVLPLHNAAGVALGVIDGWRTTLRSLNVPYEIVVIDDGSTDGTAALLEAVADPAVKVVTHATRLGTGASLRAALAVSSLPLILHAAADYPYTPGDVAVFLERIDAADERMEGVKASLVAGCRTGRPVPGVWKAVGWVYRNFLGYALGIPTEPLQGWLGFGEHLRSWTAWLVYGVPFVDPNCGFKLYRRAALERFPIQCDGDKVHIELAAKLTFLTSLIDEVPLTPKPDAVPAVSWRERRSFFRHPVFYPPPGLIPAPPAPVAQPAAQVPAAPDPVAVP